jgi:hypothetical protein
MLNNVDEPEAGLQFNDDDRNPQVYDELCRWCHQGLWKRSFGFASFYPDSRTDTMPNNCRQKEDGEGLITKPDRGGIGYL